MSRQTRRRRMRRVRRKVGGILMPIFAPGFLRALASSWKVEKLGEDNFDAAMRAPGCIATLWHGRMLLPMRAHANLGLSVLVSPSADGSLVHPLLTRLGYQTVRGSTNKSPVRATREMLERLGQGASMVITPDGPRGPMHSMNPGPAWMSRESGFPVLPCGLVTDRARHMSSWDRFTIPKWGARVVIGYGELLQVQPDASDEDIRNATEEIRTRMLREEEKGFEHLGVEKDW